jgi:hypothetical protein
MGVIDDYFKAIQNNQLQGNQNTVLGRSSNVQNIGGGGQPQPGVSSLETARSVYDPKQTEIPGGQKSAFSNLQTTAPEGGQAVNQMQYSGGVGNYPVNTVPGETLPSQVFKGTTTGAQAYRLGGKIANSDILYPSATEAAEAYKLSDPELYDILNDMGASTEAGYSGGGAIPETVGYDVMGNAITSEVGAQVGEHAVEEGAVELGTQGAVDLTGEIAESTMGDIIGEAIGSVLPIVQYAAWGKLANTGGKELIAADQGVIPTATGKLITGGPADVLGGGNDAAEGAIGAFTADPTHSINKVMDNVWSGDYGGAAHELLVQPIEDVVNVVTGKSTVICTEISRRGLIDINTKESASKYRRMISDDLYKGYLTVCSPLVQLVQISKIASFFLVPLGVAFSKEVAHRANPSLKGSILGSILIGIFKPICLVANYLRNKEVLQWLTF